jgi:hypothetical protein
MEGTPQKEQLGYTLLDRPVELNYSTSSQWIQANDGVRDPHNRDLGWPWGSIEGGHLVSHRLGGALAPPYWGARGAEPRGSCSHRTACDQALRERDFDSAGPRVSRKQGTRSSSHFSGTSRPLSFLFFWAFSLGGAQAKKDQGPRALLGFFGVGA